MGVRFSPGSLGAGIGSPWVRGAPANADTSLRLLPRSDPLTGIIVAADPVPAASLTSGPEVYADGLWMLIDEIPILAALCALASTPSRLCGLAELRVKESDRVARTAELLQAFGAAVVEAGDDLVIEPATLRAPTTTIRTDHDHRIAMTALTLGAILDVEVELDDPDCVDESWPGFASFITDTARRLRAVPAVKRWRGERG